MITVVSDSASIMYQQIEQCISINSDAALTLTHTDNSITTSSSASDKYQFQLDIQTSLKYLIRQSTTSLSMMRLRQQRVHTVKYGEEVDESEFTNYHRYVHESVVLGDDGVRKKVKVEMKEFVVCALQYTCVMYGAVNVCCSCVCVCVCVCVCACVRVCVHTVTADNLRSHT